MQLKHLTQQCLVYFKYYVYSYQGCDSNHDGYGCMDYYYYSFSFFLLRAYYMIHMVTNAGDRKVDRRESQFLVFLIWFDFLDF